MAYIQKNNPFKKLGDVPEDVIQGDELPEVLIEGKKNPKINKQAVEKASEAITEFGDKITERGKEMYEGMKKHLSMYTR